MKDNDQVPQWFCAYCGAWSSKPYCRDCRSKKDMHRRDERCNRSTKRI